MKKQTTLFVAAVVGSLSLFSTTSNIAQADDCFPMKAITLVAGEMGMWKVGALKPDSEFVIVWGTRLGNSVVKDVQDYCATFGIGGISTKRILGQGTADSFGTGVIERKIPSGTAGLTVYTQAAARGTCPDECVSNIVESTIQ